MIMMPAMNDKLMASWRTLFAVTEQMPSGWTLVGGQMVHLLCAEHHVTPVRPTDDLDAGIDVRAYPSALLDFTTALHRLGFRPDGISADGYQHRWINDDGLQYDVLIPVGVGPHLKMRQGYSGSPMVSGAGVQRALDRTQVVGVQLVDGTTGSVRRPDLLGALVVKAAAYGTADTNRQRHLTDFAILATLLTNPRDLVGMTRSDETRILSLTRTLADDPRATAMVNQGQKAVETLGQYVAQIRRRRELAGNHGASAFPFGAGR